jgi:hypothetical protein
VLLPKAPVEERKRGRGRGRREYAILNINVMMADTHQRVERATRLDSTETEIEMSAWRMSEA